MAKRPGCEKCGGGRAVKKYKSRFYTGYLCLEHRCEQLKNDELEKRLIFHNQKLESAKKKRAAKQAALLKAREERERIKREKKEKLRNDLIAQKHLTQEMYDRYLKNKEIEEKILNQLKLKVRSPEEKREAKIKDWLKKGYDPKKLLCCTNFRGHRCNPVDVDAWKRGLWDPKEIRAKGNYIIQACSWFDIKQYARTLKGQALACAEALVNKAVDNGGLNGALESEIREVIEASDRG